MKKRQVLAVVLSAAMVMGSSMTAFAALGDKSGDVTLNGDGEVSYVDTKVYNVVLPTSAAMQDKLVVDPQGISKLENGQVATAEELASGAGIITCVNTPIVQNRSSQPMKVSVEMALSGDATPVTTVDAVESGDAPQVLLYAVPSAVDAVKSGDYQPSSKGIVLTNTSAKAEFILDAGAYNFKKDDSGNVTYEPVSGDVGHGTGLQFGGYVNKKADWSDYVKASSPKKIGMTAKFSFTDQIADGEAADPSGDAYAMKTYSGTTVAVAPKDAAPSIATTTYAMVANQALVIPVDLGRGNLKATGITSVMLGNTNYLGQTVTFNAATSQITINADAINAMRGISGNVTVTVNFNDGKTSVPLTLTH